MSTARPLDTLGGRSYKTRPLWLALAALMPALALGESVHGAQLPDGAQKVGENRYRTQQSFEETLKYYKSVYPPGSYPRKAIINQPGVKAVHIINPVGKKFEGLNIYEANDEVRIFVVAVEEAKKESKQAKK